MPVFERLEVDDRDQTLEDKQEDQDGKKQRNRSSGDLFNLPGSVE